MRRDSSYWVTVSWFTVIQNKQKSRLIHDSIVTLRLMFVVLNEKLQFLLANILRQRKQKSRVIHYDKHYYFHVSSSYQKGDTTLNTDSTVLRLTGVTWRRVALPY